jgi:predicted nucleotidyltransferase component of viral defense system
MDNNENITVNIRGESIRPEPTMIITDTYQAQVQTILQKTGLAWQQVAVISKDNSFLKTITGEDDAIKLLLKAVNNRTIERDYFKLYCEMLDSSITAEEFDHLIESNETDYVVSETDEPNDTQVKTALRLSEHIKGVDSLNDFTALFSFNPNKIEALVEKYNE